MPCHGNAKTHCCIFAGVECIYLEVDTMPNRHWVCGLMREHQDWDKVLNDPRYKQNVEPLWAKYLWPGRKIKHNCKTWPAETCDCGN